MIEIRKVSKWYRDFQVLKDCSLSVTRGEVVVVCGPSGSGKSTLIKCVNGLEPIQEGDILVDGLSVRNRAEAHRLRSRVGMVFQSFELYPHLTAIENVCLAPIVVLKRTRAAAEARSDDSAGSGRFGGPCAENIPRNCPEANSNALPSRGLSQWTPS